MTYCLFCHTGLHFSSGDIFKHLIEEVLLDLIISVFIDQFHTKSASYKKTGVKTSHEVLKSLLSGIRKSIIVERYKKCLATQCQQNAQAVKKMFERFDLKGGDPG